jgi:hypothetical protein
VIPPAGSEGAFHITRRGRDVVLERRQANGGTGKAREVGRFDGLREAVLAPCPIDDEALQEIQVALETQSPRRNRG